MFKPEYSVDVYDFITKFKNYRKTFGSIIDKTTLKKLVSNIENGKVAIYVTGKFELLGVYVDESILHNKDLLEEYLATALKNVWDQYRDEIVGVETDFRKKKDEIFKLTDKKS